MDESVTQICIVGGGNAAQVMVALFGNARDNGKKLRVCHLAPFQNEAEKLRGPITLHNPDGTETTGKSDRVSKDPADVVPGSHVIFLPLPTFAMPSTLKLIAPHLDDGVMVGALPGQGGFQWMAADILGMNSPGAKNITLFGFDKLPYNCRADEYGKVVKVFGYKTHLGVAFEPCTSTSSIENAEYLTKLIPKLDELQPKKNFLVITLAPSNQCIHPARMYGLFHEKTKYDKMVNFYDDMDQKSADVMEQVSNEILLIARHIESVAKNEYDIDVDLSQCLSVGEALCKAYNVGDTTSLYTILRTVDGFHGIGTPMTPTEDGAFEADFTSRYFTEDVPTLCVLYGLANLAKVEVPTIRMLIQWAQDKMGDEYQFLDADGNLLDSTDRELFIAQHWGITNIPQLLRKTPGNVTESSSACWQKC